MTPSEGSAEFRLTEPVEIPAEARVRVELPPPDDEDAKNTPAADRQFSLRELFALMTFSAVMFSGFQWLPPGWLAFGLGVVACLGLAASSIFQIRRPSLILAWWIVLFTYIGACAIAIHRMNSPTSPPVGPW